jgi:hypothetical protein
MTVGAYNDSMLFDSQGHTGNHYYVRFVDDRSGEIWNDVSGAMEVNPSRADSAVDLVEVGTSGQFPIRVPADLPYGYYDAVIYILAGSEPADTDDVTKQITFTKGSDFGF